MDPTTIFYHGLHLGPGVPRPPPPQFYHFQRPPLPPAPRARQQHRDDDGDSHSNRIAHTLTACCRCRQRKTRCDPALPRCLPCERAGAVCEYFDTAKQKKINRSYVVKLQTRVRNLEAELAQYTDDDEFPRNTEDMVRPGGLVKLDEHDETPRYLGPSSGIAMTRLLMEEAKRFTETKQISELIPEVRSRRIDRSNRMQSIVSTGGGSISGPSSRKKSYPMISAIAADDLPVRATTEKLLQVYLQRGQIFLPILHEVLLQKDIDAVFNGDKDPHKNFIARMVMAIGLQKMESKWAGVADAYYLAAMQSFEDVIRSKDLRTLQCLVLIGQYSTLTPTRTAVYYIIGLATRICQQLGLGNEKTLTSDFDLGLIDHQVLDMRRRLAWIVMSMEYGLAHSMGRPSGFAKGDDFMDVGFFDARPDELITTEGIKEGPPSEKKLMSIHFMKMRLLQAEIRRTLYEKKRQEPREESHPWFAQMEHKLTEWRESIPKEPKWCEPWFTGRYHTMIVSLYRPSPQVPKPSNAAALRCFDSAAYIITLSPQQLIKGAVDITWIFLLTVYMSLNTLLWTISYPEVRRMHPRDKVEDLINSCLDTIDQCADRWPGTETAAQHYSHLARACLQSYEQKNAPPQQVAPPVFTNAFATPPLTDNNSPSASDSSAPTTVSGAGSLHPPANIQQASLFTTPQFNFGFDGAPPEPPFSFGETFEDEFVPRRQPQFRNNSIFANPASGEGAGGRRPSHYAPDDGPTGPSQIDDPTPPATRTPHEHLASQPNTIPTPPESFGSGGPTSSLSPPISMPDPRSISPTPPMSHHSPPLPVAMTPGPPIKYETPQTPQMSAVMTPGPPIKYEPQTPQQHPGHPTPQSTPQQQTPSTVRPQSRGGPIFAVPMVPPEHIQAFRQNQQSMQQNNQHAPVANWFNPPAPLIYNAFGQNSNNSMVFNNNTHNFGDPGATAAFLGAVPSTGFAAPGLGHGMHHHHDGLGGFGGFPVDPMRQGSLTHDQLVELMGVLEQDGMGEIDQLLSMGVGMGAGVGMGDGVRW